MLASASARRRELLTTLGVPFLVMPADADETLPPGLAPGEASIVLAERKARLVADRTELPVLAADTLVVAADGGVLGKPASASEALEMLRRLSGTTHRVITGVTCLARRRSDPALSAAAVTSVTMRPLRDEEARAYAASGEPFGKAGAYAIQEKGDRFVTRVEGSWSNVVGLPLEIVGPMLREAGVLP